MSGVSPLLSLEEFEECLDVVGRGRRLAEHTLKPVIEPAVFDERVCLTELFPEGISIAAMQMRLDHV